MLRAVASGVELERMQAMLGAEVEGLAGEFLAHGLRAVDLHAADRIADAAPHGQREKRREHSQPEDVEEELVIDLDAAEDVAAARPGAGRDQVGEAEEAVD